MVMGLFLYCDTIAIKLLDKVFLENAKQISPDTSSRAAESGAAIQITH